MTLVNSERRPPVAGAQNHGETHSGLSGLGQRDRAWVLGRVPPYGSILADHGRLPVSFRSGGENRLAHCLQGHAAASASHVCRIARSWRSLGCSRRYFTTTSRARTRVVSLGTRQSVTV